MVLVVGATGLLGSEICRLLRSAGMLTRAMVRSNSAPEKVECLRSAGADTVVADLKDPASMDRACEGVSHIIATASSTFSRQEGDSIGSVDHAGYLHLIASALKAHVGHFVYSSIPPNLKYDSPLVSAKRHVESQLAASGVPYTILTANFFMEVWLSPALAFDYKGARATVYGSGQRPIGWVSYRDVAGFAVAALGCESARNSTLNAGGPENLTPLQVIDIFSEVSGHPFEVAYVTEEYLVTQYESAEDPLGKSFAALMLEYAAGRPMDTAGTLSLLPRPLITVREYAQQVTGRI